MSPPAAQRRALADPFDEYDDEESYDRANLDYQEDEDWEDFDDGTRECSSCGATVVLHLDQRREPALVECRQCEDERWQAIEEDGG